MDVRSSSGGNAYRHYMLTASDGSSQQVYCVESGIAYNLSLIHILNNHRVLCFQLKSLGKALKEIGLLIMQDAVWNRVTANRSKHKTTWFYIDEFHLLLKGQTGSFSVEIWKRFRKWGDVYKRQQPWCQIPGHETAYGWRRHCAGGCHTDPAALRPVRLIADGQSV